MQELYWCGSSPVMANKHLIQAYQLFFLDGKPLMAYTPTGTLSTMRDLKSWRKQFVKIVAIMLLICINRTWTRMAFTDSKVISFWCWQEFLVTSAFTNGTGLCPKWWDMLLSQMVLILIFSAHPYVSSNISAYAYHHGQFDYDWMPQVSVGVR